MNWVDKYLIPEVRGWWKLWSARLLVAALAIDALSLYPVLTMLPASVRGINPLVFDVVQMVLVAAALAARLVRQPKIKAKSDAAE